MFVLLPASGNTPTWSAAADRRTGVYSQSEMRKAEYLMPTSQKNLPGDQPVSTPMLFYVVVGVTGLSIVVALGYAFFS